MTGAPGEDQTDVDDELAYERGLTVKAVVSLAVVVVLALVHQHGLI